MYGVYDVITANVRFCGPWQNFDNTNNHVLTILINKNKLITNKIGLKTRDFRSNKNLEAPDSCPVCWIYTTIVIQ